MIGRFLVLSAFGLFALAGLACFIYTAAWTASEAILWLPL